MVPLSTAALRQRSERRISVRLPLRIRGRDKRGVIFEEETSSENLCRSGAAFVTHFDIALGTDLEIRIPPSHYALRRGEPDFATRGRLCAGCADCEEAALYQTRGQFDDATNCRRLPCRGAG